MKAVLLTLTYLVGAGELVLAVFFWATHSKSRIRKVTALLVTFTSLWVLCSGIVSYAQPGTVTNIVLDFVYLFGVLLITALLHFSVLFPFPRHNFDHLHAMLLYVPAVIFGVILFSSNLIVKDFSVSPEVVGSIKGGPLFGLYNNYILLLFILSLLILGSTIRKTDGVHRRQTSIVFWSVLLGGMPAVIFDLVLPTYINVITNTLIGVISSVIWLGGLTYIVLRR